MAVSITAYDETPGNYPIELPIGDVAILRATWVVTGGNWTIDQLGAIGAEFVTNFRLPTANQTIPLGGIYLYGNDGYLCVNGYTTADPAVVGDLPSNTTNFKIIT